MQKSLVAVGVCLVIAPVVAMGASDAGWYMGASLGQSKSGYSTSKAQSDLGYDSGVNVDDSDTVWKLFGGYRVDKTWGVEFGFVNLGTTSISGRAGGAPASDEFNARGINLDGIGSWSINPDFSIFGKLGLGVIKSEYNCIQSCAVISENTKTSIVPTLGFGIQYHFSRQLGVRGELEHFNKVKFEASGPTGSLSYKVGYNVLTAGLVYNF